MKFWRMIIFAVTVLAFNTSAGIATAEAANAASQPNCLVAQRLVNDAMPGRAMELLAGLSERGQPVCQAEWKSAEAAVTAAVTKVVDGARAAEAGEWELAADLADEALALDAENPEAADLKDRAAEHAPPKTWPEELAALWQVTASRYAEPAAATLGPILAVLAALLVLARFMVLLPVKWPRVDPGETKWWWLLGISFCIGAAVVFVLGGRASLRGDMVFVVGAVLGLIGAAWMAQAMATRLRLNVEVRTADGKADEAATGRVIALLSTLAGSGAKGIEVPRGADVAVLDGSAITGSPEGKLAKLAATLVTMVLGVVPWRVRVDEENDDLVSVVITRNGRAVTSAVIDRRTLGLDFSLKAVGAVASTKTDGSETVKPDLYRVAAAAVVVALARHHEFPGLCGASDWRSLGLHDVATTQLAGDPARGRVLALAVEFDPGNMAAQVAFRHAVDRSETDAERAKAYAGWLADTDGDLRGPGYEQLRRRALHSRLAVWINVHYILAQDENADETTAEDNETVQAAQALVDFYVDQGFLVGRDGVARPRPLLDDDGLTIQSQPAAASMVLWVHDGLVGKTVEQLPAGEEAASDVATADQAKDLRAWLKRPAGPTGDYQLACYHATVERRQDQELAIKHLARAAQVSWLKSAVRKDPQLKGFTESDVYRKAFGEKPRTDLLALPLLEPYAPTLRKIGVTSAYQLALFHPAPERLAKALGIGTDLAHRMAVLGELGCQASAFGLEDFSVELCAELLDGDRANTIERARGAGAVALCEAIAKRCSSAPEADAIQSWLTGLKEPEAREISGPRVQPWEVLAAWTRLGRLPTDGLGQRSRR